MSKGLLLFINLGGMFGGNVLGPCTHRVVPDSTESELFIYESSAVNERGKYALSLLWTPSSIIAVYISSHYLE